MLKVHFGVRQRQKDWAIHWTEHFHKNIQPIASITSSKILPNNLVNMQWNLFSQLHGLILLFRNSSNCPNYRIIQNNHMNMFPIFLLTSGKVQSVCRTRSLPQDMELSHLTHVSLLIPWWKNTEMRDGWNWWKGFSVI